MSSDEDAAHLDPPRRDFIAGVGAMGAMLLAGRAERAFAQSPSVQSIRLFPEGVERALPTHILGYNAPVPFIPYELADFVPAVEELGPQVLRFPGGTIGNYYDWHSGSMNVTDGGPTSSPFRKHFHDVLEPLSRKLHPNGFFVEDWARIAKAVDADLIIMANLETSTPEDQASWFGNMKRKGVSANFVELGNEFFLGMDDDAGRAKFPTPQYASELARRFCTAIRPQLPKDAKLAVQSSSAAFNLLKAPPPNARITAQRIWQWDQALKPEPWFDAVTMHLYPTETGAAGLERVKELPATTRQVFDAMMGRADAGFDRALGDVTSRVPGKEIWITEYGGFDPYEMFLGMGLKFNGLWLHQVTREMMTIMRHPQATFAAYHSVYFYPGILMSDLLRVGDGFKPINAATVHSWFFHASRGPNCTWQRMKIEGAVQIPGNGSVPGETYWDVDAGLYRRNRDHTLFIHNASMGPRRVDLLDIVSPQTPISAETIATPDLLEALEDRAPVAAKLAVRPALEVPPYSITRVCWQI